MEDVHPFALHFARLVSLLANDRDNQDGQKEELRGALVQLSSQPATLSHHDLATTASAAVTGSEAGPDDGMRLVGDLALRMAAHSVRTLTFVATVPAREILDVARALADEPAPGDEGAAFDARLVDLALTGVSAQIGSSGFVRRASLGALPAQAAPVRTPSASVLAIARPGRPGLPDSAVRAPRRASDSQAMMQDQLMRHASADEGAVGLLDRLDAAVNAPNPGAAIDDVTQAAEELGNRHHWIDVVRVLERLHDHHDALPDGDARRAILMGIRRLQRPVLMQGVVRLLPERRDLRDACTRLLIQAGEVGADALIDSLISSEVTSERRAYLEVLKQCPAAANSLLHLLNDDRWYVVRNAAALLGELRAIQADRRLAELVAHREPRVRRSVATALGKLGTSRALLGLLQLASDASHDVRLQAVQAIGASRNPHAVPWLLEALDHEQDGDVQAAILSALGRVPTEEGVARLARAAEAGGMLVRKPGALRIRAVEALAEAGTPSARRVLESLRRDRDRDVRAAVERVAGRLASA